MTLPEAPIIHSDNMSALALNNVNPVFHSRIIHLEIDYHFIRERVQYRDLVVQYIPTDGQVADILTKGLHSPVFIRHRSNLRLGLNPAEIEGECQLMLLLPRVSDKVIFFAWCCCRKLVEQIQPNLLRLVYHTVPPKALGDEGSAQATRPAQAAPRPIFRTLAAYACV
ncbi:hypothetical protein L3X38_030341 [Prunus dulcis]|uniref:Uncharacterized protein n=1 Tax=Prunus dulcis TaxID=3755 RepID=A0AAD4VA24_PRUDU|nr:hypothetical protein L3X38_030341 [Prunus dulcis]